MVAESGQHHLGPTNLNACTQRTAQDNWQVPLSPHLIAARKSLFLIFKYEKKTRSCSLQCKAENAVDAVRRAVTWTVWRTHEFAVLLLVQQPAPVLRWKHYLVAGYLGTSEAEGKL